MIVKIYDYEKEEKKWKNHCVFTHSWILKWEVIHIGVTIIATFEFRSRESFLPSLTEASQPGCYFTNIAGNVFGDFRGGHNASSIIIIIYNLCQKKRHVHFFIVNKNNNLYLFAFCRLHRLDTRVKRHYYIKDVRCIGIIGQLVAELIIICLDVIRCNFPFKKPLSSSYWRSWWRLTQGHFFCNSQERFD